MKKIFSKSQVIITLAWAPLYVWGIGWTVLGALWNHWAFLALLLTGLWVFVPMAVAEKLSPKAEIEPVENPESELESDEPVEDSESELESDEPVEDPELEPAHHGRSMAGYITGLVLSLAGVGFSVFGAIADEWSWLGAVPFFGMGVIGAIMALCGELTQIRHEKKRRLKEE